MVKELRFELCHQIKLSSTWIMCVAIHHQGNLIAIGGLDTNVTIFDITTMNQKENEQNNGFPYTRPKDKKSVSSKSSKPSTPSTPTTSPTIDTKIEIEGKDILFSELTFWEEYISCIEFLNDEEHIIVGSGDGTATICNYIYKTKIFQWKCDCDVISVDYLYLDPEDIKQLSSAWNRGKTERINHGRKLKINKEIKKTKKKWHQ